MIILVRIEGSWSIITFHKSEKEGDGLFDSRDLFLRRRRALEQEEIEKLSIISPSKPLSIEICQTSIEAIQQADKITDDEVFHKRLIVLHKR
jgi:hypothetical protein